MKAPVVESPRHAVFKDIPTPVPQGHEVLAKVVRAGICGTDNAIYTGDCSFVRDGLIKYPVRFGHEWSGVVEAVGSEVTDFKKGDRIVSDNGVSCGKCPACLEKRYGDCPHNRAVGTVNCWDGCFAEYFLIPDYHVYHLEDSITLDQAALIEPMSIAYDGFRDVALNADSTVAVIGTGPIGMTAVALAKHYGAGKIIMVGRRDSKLAVASQVGATDLVNNTQTDAVQAVMEITGGQGADLVLETAGTESCLRDAIRMAKKSGQISVIAFYEKEVGNLPIDRLVLDCVRLQGAAGHFGNIEACKNIMASWDIDLTPLITHRVKFDDCLEFFENDDKYHKDKIKVMIEF